MIFSRLFLFLIALFFSCYCFSQGCCSGGSGSPIAGGASQGVLSRQQVDVSSTFQYTNSSKFKAGNKDTALLFDNFNSNYMYTKIAYGVTKEFTFSVETGYFINKTQVGLNKIETNRSSGLADLIIFPRYDVYNRTDSSKRVELTLGMGYKIPLGKYSDSTIAYHDSATGRNTYILMPPLVQPTNGSHDFIFYAFFLRGFPKHNFKLFSNALYIKKGWNSLGEKFGDFASVSLFAGKTFFNKLGITLQVKGERIAKMQAAKGDDLMIKYSVDVASTGSKKIMFVPQLSYNINKSLTVFGLFEMPLYEYVNGSQLATQKLIVTGFSYRFFAKKNIVCVNPFVETYMCPMKCEAGISNKPGKCKVCGMELEKSK